MIRIAADRRSRGLRRTAERRALAREAARRAIVLMSNRTRSLAALRRNQTPRRDRSLGCGAGRDAGILGFGGPA